ncbi:MAG: type III PLP-dependent enzyme [Pseudomonadota bacterium]
MSQYPHYRDTLDFIQTREPTDFTFIYRAHHLKAQVQNFIHHFPGQTLYALKCNPEPTIINDLIASHITHFDVASLHEIDLIAKNAKNHPTKQIKNFYMHPVKPRHTILKAWDQGIRHFVIDHIDELEKIKQSVPNITQCLIFVRIGLPDLGSLIDLSLKFGAPIAQAPKLLQDVERSGAEVGVAFHAGTQISTPQAFVKAIDLAAQIIKKSSVQCQHLDIGGGFPALYVNERPPPINHIIDDIKSALEKNNIIPIQKDKGNTYLYCEPGRALVAECMSLVTQIHARYDDMIFINCGRYHGMLEMALMEIQHPVRLIRKNGVTQVKESDMMPFIIQGPTCDSLDKLRLPIPLPKDSKEGDWIEFGTVGSYSVPIITNFNGIAGGDIVACDDHGPLATD